MTKKELINAIAKSSGITPDQGRKALDCFIAEVKQSLCHNEEVRLAGFGTFALSPRAARKGRNPKTGEELDIAAGFQVKFKAGSDLKAAVNETAKSGD
ncbi:MAG: HU family DNA-binding protein [Kistimonas sp.]|nr:HU family DNA-binding protein [Kistimonas sp.]